MLDPVLVDHITAVGLSRVDCQNGDELFRAFGAVPAEPVLHHGLFDHRRCAGAVAVDVHRCVDIVRCWHT